MDNNYTICDLSCMTYSASDIYNCWAYSRTPDRYVRDNYYLYTLSESYKK